MSEAGSSPTRIVAKPSSPSTATSSFTSARIRSASAFPSRTVATPETLACCLMDTEQLAPDADEKNVYAGVLRYYELAKRAEWHLDDLPWNGLPPIPEYKGGPEKLARRRELWRSVIMQQLQADMFACEMASQLLNAAPHPEARLYYSTMVQDEARHTEAWLKLMEISGGESERDPYLDQLAAMFLNLDSPVEKGVLIQVFFRPLI